MDSQTTVLIVDDNPGDHALFRRLLNQVPQRRFIFHEAELASRALDIIAATHIDCVLLDYNLPDSDGLEVIAALTRDDGSPTATPVVMLTGVGNERVAVQALQAGAMDYLIKERLSGPRLAQVIDEAQQRHRLRAELHTRQRYLEQRTMELEQSVASLQERLAEELGRAELLAALEAERASLAQRVAERTADLRAANAALARAARLKDEFLANMSHELRTPLNAILGRSELLREEFYGGLTPKQAKAVQVIEEAGHHLLSLINDILDLSKVEAGKVELELDTVNVEEIAGASLRMVSEAARAKQITLSTTYTLAESWISADKRRLKQIIVNLLSNAVKFTPPGGKVGLEIRDDAEQRTITFGVWDSGIGITQEDQERLFQPFVQLDSTLRRQNDGAGLGLALVQRLTELHGGSVALASAVGQGSRFSVTLPLAGSPRTATKARPQQSSPTPPTAEAAGSAHAVILLAEDNQHNVAMVGDYLTAHGYQVVVAPNGAEAVLEAQEQRPDVILMDVQMPAMDGLEAIRRIRAAGLVDTPIVALTALTMPGDRERCLEAGANDYLTKPASLRELHQVIRQLLRTGPS